MVQMGYSSDEEDAVFEPVKQKYTLRKPVTPYICSTPCDFEEERTFLTEKIVPQLEDLCHQRGTRFNPYDIQWKPDSFQTESGHLLRVNLDFIVKCSPYFLCLLGETYGPHRVPDIGKLPESLHAMTEDTPWLDRNYLTAAAAGYKWIMKEVHQNCSIPELEIIQAVFLGDSHRCHFYYRQPEHLDNKMDGASEEEKARLTSIHKPDSEYADLNIRDLKQRIVNKGLPVKYFRTCAELGNHVLADWREIIDELYPPLLDGPSLLDQEDYREWLSHEVFSESRRHVYLNHAELRNLKMELTTFCESVLDEPGLEFEDELSQRFTSNSASSALRKHQDIVVKHKSVLVVKSDRGMGKSSLVANWVRQFASENRDVKVISHFIGSSGKSRDVMTFLRRCVLELREEYMPDECSSVSNLELVSQNFKELCGSFQASLTLGPCVLLLDGVDELGATLDLSPQQIKSFSWIPLPLPPQCRIVITTLVSDLSCTNLRKRPDASFLTLSNLNTTKVKAELLEDHMQMHYEHLKRFQLQTLFESKMSGRPLFLTILGNEMCSHGVYTELDAYTETIREMCTSIRDLYVRCFKRWSRDHSWTYEVLSAEQTESEEADYIGWVPDVLRLLAVSRSGLTANEILDVLVAMGYQENVKVTQFDWLVFLKCIGENLTESPYGVFNFAHQHMREVVEYVLLRTVKPSTAELITLSDVDQVWKKQKQEFHSHLAQYFRTLPHGQRRAEELPWQLLMAGDFEGLKEELTNPEMFEKLFDAEGKSPSNHYDLSRNWFYLEKAGHSAADAYKHLLTQIGLLDKQLDDIEVESIGYASSSTSGDEFMASPSPESHDRLTPPQIMLYKTPSPGMPSIYTTPASETHKLSVIDEASDVMSRQDDRSDAGSVADPVFLTQDQPEPEEVHYDLSPAEIVTLGWHISQFMFELGHKQTGEAILMALNARMMKAYPLTESDQLVHAKVQEALGQLFLDQGDLETAERWYKKALRTIMDMFEAEDNEEIAHEIQALKCTVIDAIGHLRVEEGMLEDGDDLLQEALDLSEVIRSLPAQTKVLYHIGNLRRKQFDFLMAETNLRKCLLLRQRWYGRSHPLVADVLFFLGKLMSDENNDKGYDRSSAGNAFRRCLEVREAHLDKDDLLVAEVLLELGKLLKFETSYSGRVECQSVLSRALDIRIAKLGGDHIETRAVRSYLNNLEVSLKTAKNDVRSSERPYSSLTWRSHDLANIERKSHLQSAKSSSFGQLSRPGSTLSKAGSHMSRSYSQNMSRPVSGHFDVTGAPMSQRTSLASFLPASERIMLETSKPRLLHRESVDRKLKQKLEVMSPQYSPHEEQISDSENKKHIHVDMEAVSERNGHAVDSGTLLDSYGNEGEKTSVKFRSSPLSPHSQENRLGAETPPQRLFRRFGSPQNASGDAMVVRSGEVALRTSENSFIPRRETSHKHKRPVGSARSVGSSLYTSYSGTSITSHKSNCDIPRGPFSIHLSNSRTTTMGPHSSVTSLLGDTGPRDISKGIHHKSAWYHVPGRYTTPDLKHAPKRSQKRSEAKDLEKTIAPTAPNPYTTFMKSDYRKNNPNMLYKGYPEWNGHTCTKGKTNTPYPRHDKKQYTICEQCRHDAEEILAEREEELMRMVECGTEVEMGLAPTVNGLTAPDRPRQMGYVLEEPIIPEDYGHPPTVTLKDTVVFN